MKKKILISVLVLLALLLVAWGAYNYILKDTLEVNEEYSEMVAYEDLAEYEELIEYEDLSEYEEIIELEEIANYEGVE